MVRRATLSIFALTLSLVVVTLVALEGGEVVVLVTSDQAGGRRQTRAWIAEENAQLWIESANEEREFYRDIIGGSAVEIDRGDGSRRYRAIPAPNPEGHVRIRRLLREKYGWADAWIGMLADTSGSVGIRLQQIDED